jgi:hypothetical protein
MWYPEGNERSLSVMFNHYTVEALRMHWLKRDRWKAGIALADMLLLLVLMVWVPVSAAGAYEGGSGLATLVTGTVQATPTIDATVTELNKEKLEQEVQQLKNQNEQYKIQNEPDFNVWLQNYGLVWLRTIASILLSTLVVVIGGLIGLGRWIGDRSDRRDKDLKDRAEERFKTAVTALGDRNDGVQVGGAILLRTFLRPGYRQFYVQTFDLAVAYLCLPRTPLPSEDPDRIPRSPQDSDTPLPLTPLRQALIVAFREAYPLSRNEYFGSEVAWVGLVDASGIQLDKAYLMGADLEGIWIPQASLRGADLRNANLSNALLSEANFGRANLSGADLSGADLSGTNLEDTLSLEGTNLRGVKGLMKAQLETCKAKGAIIDEGTSTSQSQSTVSPAPSSQNSEEQVPLTSPAQVKTPPHSTDGSSVTSSQPNPGE